MQRNESIPENIIAAIKAGKDSEVIQFIEENPKARINATDANGRSLIEHAIENDKFALAGKLMENPAFDITKSANLAKLCDSKIKENTDNIEAAFTAAEKKPFVAMKQQLGQLKQTVARLQNPQIQKAIDKQSEKGLKDVVEAQGGKDIFIQKLTGAADAAQVLVTRNQQKISIQKEMLAAAKDDAKAQIKFLEGYEKKNKDKDTKAIVAELKEEARERLGTKATQSDPGAARKEGTADPRRTKTDSKVKEAKSGSTRGVLTKIFKGSTTTAIRQDRAASAEAIAKKEKAPSVTAAPEVPRAAATSPEPKKDSESSYSTPGLGRRNK